MKLKIGIFIISILCVSGIQVAGYSWNEELLNLIVSDSTRMQEYVQNTPSFIGNNQNINSKAQAQLIVEQKMNIAVKAYIQARETIKTFSPEIKEKVEMIENVLVDYCAKNNITLADVNFSIFKQAIKERMNELKGSNWVKYSQLQYACADALGHLIGVNFVYQSFYVDRENTLDSGFNLSFSIAHSLQKRKANCQSQSFLFSLVAEETGWFEGVGIVLLDKKYLGTQHMTNSILLPETSQGQYKWDVFDVRLRKGFQGRKADDLHGIVRSRGFEELSCFVAWKNEDGSKVLKEILLSVLREQGNRSKISSLTVPMLESDRLRSWAGAYYILAHNENNQTKKGVYTQQARSYEVKASEVFIFEPVFSVEERMVRANSYMQARQPQLAIIELNKVIEKEPNHKKAKFLRGVANYKIATSLQTTNKHLETTGTYNSSQTLSLLLASKEDFLFVAQNGVSAIEKRNALGMLASTYEYLGENKNALQTYKQLQLLIQSNEKSSAQRFKIYVAKKIEELQGKVSLQQTRENKRNESSFPQEESTPVLQTQLPVTVQPPVEGQNVPELVPQEDKSAEMYAFSAYQAQKSAQFSKAIKLYTKAIAKEPNNPIYYVNRALAYYSYAGELGKNANEYTKMMRNYELATVDQAKAEVVAREKNREINVWILNKIQKPQKITQGVQLQPGVMRRTFQGDLKVNESVYEKK